MTDNISMGRHDVLMNQVLSCLTALGEVSAVGAQMNYSRLNILDKVLSGLIRTTLLIGIASKNHLDWCSLAELGRMLEKWGVQ